MLLNVHHTAQLPAFLALRGSYSGLKSHQCPPLTLLYDSTVISSLI